MRRAGSVSMILETMAVDVILKRFESPDEARILRGASSR